MAALSRRRLATNLLALSLLAQTATAQICGPRQNLTNNLVQETRAAWAPSGERIVYMLSAGTSGSGIPFHLGWVNGDGSGGGVLAAQASACGFGLGWTPSFLGTSTVLTLEQCSLWEYMSVDVSQAPITRTSTNDDGQGMSRLLFVPGGGGGDFIKASDDGSTFIWTVTVGGTSELRHGTAADLDGSAADEVGTVLASKAPGGSGFPWDRGAALAPDGSYAIVSLASGAGNDLFAFGIRGAPPVARLTTSGEDEGRVNVFPDISADGTKVAFHSALPGDFADIWQIGTDGADLVNLTQTTDFSEGVPTWSPDGNRIAFEGGDGSKPGDLFVMDCSGSTSEPETSPEITVSSQGSPESAVVAQAPDGSSAVIWQARDGDDNGIFARMYAPDGSPAGPRFQVSSGSGSQTLPSAAIDASGRLFVAWSEETGLALKQPGGGIAMVGVTDSAVVGRFFEPSGAPATGEIEIARGPSGTSQTPQVATDDGGDAIVVWDDGDRIRGRRVDRQGRPAPQVIELSPGPASAPRTAASSSGSFVVVYQNSTGGLVGRLFDPQQQPTSGEIEISSAPGAASPAVDMADDGRFVAVWEEPGAGGGDVKGRLFDPDGEAQGGPFPLGQDNSPDQQDPDVAMNAVGDFAVTWVADRLAARGRAAGGNIVGRFFTPSGQPASGEVAVAGTEGGDEPAEPRISLNDADDATVVFTRRDGGGRSQGVFRTDVDGAVRGPSCSQSDTVLCVQQNRFRVTVSWEDKAGATGQGRAVALTSDTGYFWFFDQNNVEMVIKVLEGCPLNGNYWVFAGGLTDVEVKVRVEDTRTGEVKTYFNLQDRPFAPIQDTSAFATCEENRPGARATDLQIEQSAAREWTEVLALASGSPIGSRTSAHSCADTDTLCLGGSRFEIRVDWATSSSTGTGQAQQLTADTGYFWFFDQNNVEMVIKVLDACGLNGHYWVFAGGLTDQGVTIRVLDTQTGTETTYSNELGVPFQPVQDTEALMTCP